MLTTLITRDVDDEPVQAERARKPSRLARMHEGGEEYLARGWHEAPEALSLSGGGKERKVEDREGCWHRNGRLELASRETGSAQCRLSSLSRSAFHSIQARGSRRIYSWACYFFAAKVETTVRG